MNEQERSFSKLEIIITLAVAAFFVAFVAYSLWLAWQLGFLPFFNSSRTKPIETTQHIVIVPNFIGIDFTNAQKMAASKGLKLQVLSKNNTCTRSNRATPTYTSIVAHQDPQSGVNAPYGSTIVILLAQCQSSSPARELSVSTLNT